MANGVEETFDIYAATVIWDGTPCNILAEAASTAPLVGMALLSGYDVCIQVRNGGRVLIETLKDIDQKGAI